MSVTLTTVNVTGPRTNQSGAITQWQINATTSDASGCEAIRAAPGLGYEHCITRLEIFLNAAITVTLGASEASGAVEDIILGPMGGAVGHISMDFSDRPLAVRGNHSFVFDTSGAGSITIYAEGFTRAQAIADTAIPSSSLSSSVSSSPSSSASA